MSIDLCAFVMFSFAFTNIVGGEFLDIPYWKFCELFFEADNGFIILQVVVNPSLAHAWLEHQALLSVFYHMWSLAHVDTIRWIDRGHNQSWGQVFDFVDKHRFQLFQKTQRKNQRFPWKDEAWHMCKT